MPKVEDGFSVLEALIAAALFAVAIGVLLALVIRSAEQALRTELATAALTFAQAKLEEFRSQRFQFDASGLRLEAPALEPSAADAHLSDTPPLVESLDRFGDAGALAASVMFVRRWSVVVPDGDVDTRLITVCVVAVSPGGWALRPACVWGIRTRQP